METWEFLLVSTGLCNLHHRGERPLNHAGARLYFAPHPPQYVDMLPMQSLINDEGVLV